MRQKIDRLRNGARGALASSASIAMLMATATVYASTADPVLTWIGRVALVVGGVLLLVRCATEHHVRHTIGQAGQSSRNALMLGSSLAVLALLQPSDEIQLAVTSFFQFLLLVALALTQRRNVTWSLLTCFAMLTATFVFVIGNGAAILLTSGEGGLFENPNALGASALALALLCWRVCRWLTVSLRSLVALLLVALAGLVVYSGARAALAAGAIALLWLMCSRAASERVTRVIFGLVVAAAVSLAPLVVIFGSEFIDWTTQMDLLGKSVFTGRDEIWPFVILGILEQPWLGHGAGALPGGLLLGRLEGLSAHNGFLQLAFQFGVIGVVLFVGFILAVGLTRFAGESKASREVTRAILIAAVLHEVFEVMLTQNHFGIGFAFWVAAVVSHTPEFVHRKTRTARPSQVSLAAHDAFQMPERSQA